MDVINKFYSSVSNTVSQLSGVLPGNPVTREYEVVSHIASAGPGLLWKIYAGYKKTTKQEAAIFVFEKRYLERFNKGDRDLILDSLKRGVVHLTKLRHPQILTVQHPLEESRESLAFATEPVFASLANTLGQTDNMPMPPPAEVTDYKFFEVEIKYGLLQVGEGLAFLHSDVKLLHRNICTESIIINKQGAWKIFGFDFCALNESPPNTQPFWSFQEYSSLMPPVCQPCLSYLAPEHSLTQHHSAASDIFSLGMVAYTLYSPVHQPVIPCTDYSTFKKRAQQLKQLPVSKLQPIAEGLREYVKMMLNTSPELRPDAHQFVKIPFFDDVGVKTLNYLDSLLQWDNVQKSQFYRGLPEALQKLPPRVRLLRVLPCLVRDLVQPLMVPFVLPNVLQIAEHCSQDQYIRHILPHLRPVMRLNEPIQILLIFVQRMELLLKLTPADEVQREVLPMLYRGLDSDTHQIHELCLNALPTFAGLLDHAAVKNSVLPRVKRLCLSTQSLSVRVNCLLCLGRLLEHLDKWLVLDEVLPFLPQIPSREPAVLMGILGIYKMALDHKKLGITKEVIASRILPFLIPLCIENGLTLTQFNALVALVKRMFETVESEHRSKLQQLNSVQQEKKTLEMSFTTNPTVTSQPIDAKLEDIFSGLGLDNYLTASPTHVPAVTKETPKEVTSPGQLSLQDKQRLAQQQEAAKLLQNQSVLSPTLVAPLSKPVTKDLTATLPQPQQWSSLSSQPQTALPANPQWVQSSSNFVKQFPALPNQSTTPSIPPVPNQTNFSPNWVQSPTAAAGSPWASNKMAPTTTNGATLQQNWSALDSLLPTVGSQKVPMNQMQLVKQPLLFQQPAPQHAVKSNETNKNSTLLSSDDIMDLLS